MEATSVARFTRASVTPSSLRTAFSMRRTHDAQVMPPMSSVQVSVASGGAVVVMQAPWSGTSDVAKIRRAACLAAVQPVCGSLVRSGDPSVGHDVAVADDHPQRFLVAGQGTQVLQRVAFDDQQVGVRARCYDAE